MNADTIPFGVTTDTTMKKLFAGAEERVGADKLFIYDARSQNCQYFVKALLDRPGRTGWNSTVEKFVMQDAEKVMEGMGLLGDIARKATDLAHVADVALNGAGR